MKVILKGIGVLLGLLVLGAVVLGGYFAYTLFNTESFSLEFNLTEDDYADFVDAAQEFEASIAEDKNDLVVLLKTATFTSSFYKIEAQYQIAYINYCQDMKDEKALADYEFAYKTLNNAMNLYNGTLKNLLLSDSAQAAKLFESWEDSDKELILNNNDNAYRLNEENEALLLEYRALDSDAEGWIDTVDGIYLEVVLNNNAIAKEYKYADYYEYASSAQYYRNYTSQQRQKLRLYVKEYIVPLADEVHGRLEALRDSASEEAMAEYAALMTDSYTANDDVKSYISSYIDTFYNDGYDLEGVGDSMAKMFDNNMAVFANGENALPAAFTSYLTYYLTPIAYFGPGYQDMLTVVHELGHYAAFDRLTVSTAPLDFCEVHSQANEWLFVAYLEDQLDPEVYELLMLSRLSRGLDGIIASVAVDECEEMIYSSVNESSSKEQIARIITETLASYGEQTVEDLQLENYFRYVAVDNPVYYLSYATSEIVSITSFITAQEDLEIAQMEYTYFIDSSVDLDSKLFGLIAAFDENTFIEIVNQFSTSSKEDDVTVPDAPENGAAYLDETDVLLPAA